MIGLSRNLTIISSVFSTAMSSCSRVQSRELAIQILKPTFKTYKGDAAKFDFSTIGPVSAVLLDIDLYQPTLGCLRAIWPYLVKGGGIVIDDCIPGGPWDGSLQAVEEFAIEIGSHASRVGGKGMMLFKNS